MSERQFTPEQQMAMWQIVIRVSMMEHTTLAKIQELTKDAAAVADAIEADEKLQSDSAKHRHIRNREDAE